MTDDIVLDRPDTITDHLDLAVHPRERARPAFRLVVCAEDRRVLTHAQLDLTTCPDQPPDDVAGRFIGLLAEHGICQLLLAVVIRPGAPAVSPRDRQWYHAVRAACTAHGVPLLGVHLVTPGTVREITLDDAL